MVKVQLEPCRDFNYKPRHNVAINANRDIRVTRYSVPPDRLIWPAHAPKQYWYERKAYDGCQRLLIVARIMYNVDVATDQA